MARTKASSLSAGAVKARVLGLEGTRVVADDPMIASFLNFLALDMTRSPHRIRPLDATLAAPMGHLTKGMTVDANEDLGDNRLI